MVGEALSSGTFERRALQGKVLSGKRAPEKRQHLKGGGAQSRVQDEVRVNLFDSHFRDIAVAPGASSNVIKDSKVAQKSELRRHQDIIADKDVIIAKLLQE
jgi:hypothetical protein